MGGIQDLPIELLFLIMECFSDNRKCFVARMSNRFGGGLDFPSFVRAAHLRYIRQERDLASLGTEAVEDKIRQVFDSTRDTAPPELHKFSVSALCIMLELGEDATRIIDMYSQEALANMAEKPKAEFYIARQSTELTQDERRRFMNVAFTFESYCLTFFYQRKVLFGRDNNFRQMFFDKPSSDTHSKNKTVVGRFYCIMSYIRYKHLEILSRVTWRLESIHGRAASPSLTDGTRQYLEQRFLNSIHRNYEEISVEYSCHLTCHGLNILVGLQEMSIKELTRSTVTTYLGVRELDYIDVSFMTDCPDFRSRRLYWSWYPREYLEEILEELHTLGLNGDWNDTWSRAIPFWDPSENVNPYGKDYRGLSKFWFLHRTLYRL
ncbi:hypothetical protein FCULG_00008368 [Fusarium culmorum]|uniref:Uncharacterized protein n=1 Tax=Fusarium culmorum TaxID=5516 RepID=A0A2T4H0W2_FUSCU|nr:hypothetical protein FCULG_00008368 [Fusarium culmorum]